MKQSKRVWVIPIEPIDTRYTGQWYEHIPVDLEKYAESKGIKLRVDQIEGEQIPATTSPGAFLDFGGTNVWKSSQMVEIATLFNQGIIKSGDTFLYTDAWNPSVIQLKYMSELLNIPVKIVGIWHAGSYDPQDFLGRLVGDKPWARYAERSMYSCYDVNVFATEFHKDLFMRTFSAVNGNKAIRSGFPMSYFPHLLERFKKPVSQRKNNIVFPHRLAPEKQPEIFKDLSKSLPEFNWIICQDKKLTKDQYHTLLGESKIVFSANLQETLGITTCIEGPLLGTVPMAPNRLSYSEIFGDYPEFMYDSNWTESWDSYLKNKDKLVEHIMYVMSNYEVFSRLTESFTKGRLTDFINPDLMYQAILGV